MTHIAHHCDELEDLHAEAQDGMPRPQEDDEGQIGLSERD